MQTNVKTKPDGSTIYESVEGHDIHTLEELLARREREGVTGEMSPNVEHNMLLRQFVDKFTHEFGTPSAEDCYFIVSKAHLGKDKEGKDEPDILLSLHGAPDDISCLLAFTLCKYPMILQVVERAVQYAKARQLKRQLGGLFDGLAQVFGHKSAEEWSDSVNKNRPAEEKKEPQPDPATDKPAT